MKVVDLAEVYRGLVTIYIQIISGLASRQSYNTLTFETDLLRFLTSSSLQWDSKRTPKL